MAPATPGDFARPASWYDKPPPKIRDAQLVEGFGIDPKIQLPELKSYATSMQTKLNPENRQYRSNEDAVLRNKRAQQAWENLDPQLKHRAPQKWAVEALAQLMSRMRTNANRTPARTAPANSQQHTAQPQPSTSAPPQQHTAQPQPSTSAPPQQHTAQPQPSTSAPQQPYSHNLVIRSSAASARAPPTTRNPWPKEARIVFRAAERNEELVSWRPNTLAEPDESGLLQLSWSKVAAAVVGVLSANNLHYTDVPLYMGPRPMQHLPVCEDAGLRTAFDDVLDGGIMVATLIDRRPGSRCDGDSLAGTPGAMTATPIEANNHVAVSEQEVLGTDTSGLPGGAEGENIDGPTDVESSHEKLDASLPREDLPPSPPLLTTQRQQSAAAPALGIKRRASNEAPARDQSPMKVPKTIAPAVEDDEMRQSDSDSEMGEDPTGDAARQLDKDDLFYTLSAQIVGMSEAESCNNRFAELAEEQCPDVGIVDASVVIGGRAPVFMDTIARIAGSAQHGRTAWFSGNVFDALLEIERTPNNVLILPSDTAELSDTDLARRLGSYRDRLATGEVERVLFVLCVRQNHWMAVSIHLASQRLRIIDSQHSQPPQSTEINAMVDKLQRISNELCKLKPQPLYAASPGKLPLLPPVWERGFVQVNDVDCGPFALYHLVGSIYHPSTIPLKFAAVNAGTLIRRACADRLLARLNGQADERSCLAVLFGFRARIIEPSNPFGGLDGGRNDGESNNVNIPQAGDSSNTDTPPADGSNTTPADNADLPQAGINNNADVPEAGGSSNTDIPPADGSNTTPAGNTDLLQGGIDNNTDVPQADGSNSIKDIMPDYLWLEKPTLDEVTEETPAQVLQQDPTLGKILARVDQDQIDRVCNLLPWVREEAVYKAYVDGTDIDTCGRWGTARGFTFKPYQLDFIAWGFLQERGIMGGGTLADQPGNGKTVQALGLLVLHHLHRENMEEVECAWRNQDTAKHFPQDAADDATCANSPAMRCYCEPRARRELYHSPKQVAMNCIMTPAAGIGSFAGDATKMLKDSRLVAGPGGMRIALHAESYGRPGQKDPWLKLRPREIAQCAAQVYEWAELPDEVLGKRDGKWNVEYFGIQPEVADGDPGDLAKRVTIITTLDSFVNVLNLFTLERKARYTLPNGKVTATKTQSLNGAVVSRFIQDECHHRVKAEALQANLTQLRNSYHAVSDKYPAFWGLTGTPDYGGLVNQLRFTAQSLGCKTWTKNPILQALAPKQSSDSSRRTFPAVDALDTDYRWLTTHPDYAKATAKQAHRNEWNRRSANIYEALKRLLPLYQMRRDDDTVWHSGKKLKVVLAELDLQYIACVPAPAECEIVSSHEAGIIAEINRRHREALAAWESRQEHTGKAGPKPEKRRPTKTTNYHSAVAAASVAPLVEFWSIICRAHGVDPNQSSFTKDNQLMQKWLTEGKGRLPRDVIRRSDVEYACKYIELKKQLRLREKSRCVESDTRVKVLIMVDHPNALAAIAAMLEDDFPHQCIMYTAGMSQKARKEALQTFEEKELSWILVATRKSVGEAVNLQRASVVILMEPPCFDATLTQAYCRALRKGQREPVVTTLVLHNEASTIEQRWMRVCASERRLREEAANARLDGTEDNPQVVREDTVGEM